ncbi:MAG: rod shape-determining protein RodA [Saprospiraceae bacterium]|nr:rod shape-determining protein RodA [Saprospiraceae bacterium]
MLRNRITGYYDWITIGLYLSLLVIGWLAIYSVSYTQISGMDLLNLENPITKQSFYLLVALLVFGISQAISEKFWHTFSYLIYAVSLLLLVLVLIVGTEVKGAKAWFNFGGFSFQPAEFAKFGTALALSSFMTFYKTNLKQLYFQGISFGIILAPVLLILLQPDAGSALTFFSFFILLYLEGLNALYFLSVLLLIAVFILSFLFPISWILAGLIFLGLIVAWGFAKSFKYKWVLLLFITILLAGCGIILGIDKLLILSGIPLLGAVIYLWKSKEEALALVIPVSIGFLWLVSYFSVSFIEKLEPHQQERIKVWLKPEECDPRGSLYNVLQSKVAIGAGGFAGKGFLEGNMTKLKFVPEQSTDFIFSSIGEEHGFIGSITVVILFAVLIFRLFTIGERAEKKFVSSFATCVAGLLLFHVIINIGMTVGLFPIVGIPLPFISKGGSALIGFSLMLGVLFKMQSKA